MRVGAGRIKGVDPAAATELVLCHSSIEAVRDERIRAAQQLEVRGLYDQVDVALFGAERTVAVGGAGQLRAHREANQTAVARARVERHGFSRRCRAALARSR